jgi:hypothetical protein
MLARRWTTDGQILSILDNLSRSDNDQLVRQAAGHELERLKHRPQLSFCGKYLSPPVPVPESSSKNPKTTI